MNVAPTFHRIKEQVKLVHLYRLTDPTRFQNTPGDFTIPNEYPIEAAVGVWSKKLLEVINKVTLLDLSHL